MRGGPFQWQVGATAPPRKKNLEYILFFGHLQKQRLIVFVCVREREFGDEGRVREAS